MIYSEDRTFAVQFIQNQERGSDSHRAARSPYAGENHLRQRVVIHVFGLFLIGRIRSVRISAEMIIQVDQPERFEFHREALSNKTQERYGQNPHAYCCAYESHKDEILAEGQDCQLYEARRSGEVIEAVRDGHQKALDWVVAWFHSGPVGVGRMAKSQTHSHFRILAIPVKKVWKKHRFPNVIPFSKARHVLSPS